MELLAQRLEWTPRDGQVISSCLAFLRELLAEHVLDRFRGRPADVPLVPFGSAVNGFGVSGNFDLDCTLFLPPEDEAEADGIWDAFLRTILSLRKRRTAGAPAFVVGPVLDLRRLRYPIIKFSVYLIRHRLAVPVDLSINPNVCGVCNTAVLSRLSALHPMIQRFVLLVKTWAKRQGVVDSEGGMLNSLCMTTMALFFAQSLDIAPAWTVRRSIMDDASSVILALGRHRLLCFEDDSVHFSVAVNDTLGELFCQFMVFLLRFDFSKFGIHLSGHTRIPRDAIPRSWAHSECALWVSDPVNVSDNVARRIDADKLAFVRLQAKNALMLLSESSAENQRPVLEKLFVQSCTPADAVARCLADELLRMHLPWPAFHPDLSWWPSLEPRWCALAPSLQQHVRALCRCIAGHPLLLPAQPFLKCHLLPLVLSFVSEYHHTAVAAVARLHDDTTENPQPRIHLLRSELEAAALFAVSLLHSSMLKSLVQFRKISTRAFRPVHKGHVPRAVCLGSWTAVQMEAAVPGTAVVGPYRCKDSEEARQLQTLFPALARDAAACAVCCREMLASLLSHAGEDLQQQFL